jgi:hypothetical protein
MVQIDGTGRHAAAHRRTGIECPIHRRQAGKKSPGTAWARQPVRRPSLDRGLRRIPVGRRSPIDPEDSHPARSAHPATTALPLSPSLSLSRSRSLFGQPPARPKRADAIPSRRRRPALPGFNFFHGRYTPVHSTLGLRASPLANGRQADSQDRMDHREREWQAWVKEPLTAADRVVAVRPWIPAAPRSRATRAGEAGGRVHPS